MTSTTDHLKTLYSAYRNTADIDARGAFFSPDCIQICRPDPTYAATNRQTIVQYLHDAQKDVAPASNNNGYYTIRPLRPDEFSFETDEVVAPTGLTSAGLKQRAVVDGWVGMRVDLWWDASGAGEEGFLVKVQYWWRKEGDQWLQILHDITYMGPRDGTEGQEGEILE